MDTLHQRAWAALTFGGVDLGALLLVAGAAKQGIGRDFAGFDARLVEGVVVQELARDSGLDLQHVQQLAEGEGVDFGHVGLAGAGERQCFPQTGHCVEGRFLQYWRENGGLPVFGYPIGPARDERNRDTGVVYLTQWFERNRFELHPENRQPFRVLLGLLGNEMSAGSPAPAGAAVTYAAQDGGVYEIRAGGQVASIGTAANMGKVLDGVRRGNQVTLLREQGLQRLTVGGSATTIATFTRGNAQFGSLIAPTDTTSIIYNYNRRNDANFSGFTGIVGVIEGTTARKVFENENQMLVLGVSLDERKVYVVDWGGDPAIWGVRVVSLEDGRDVGAISTENGYAAAVLSPSRNIIALGYQRPAAGANEVALFEVFNEKQATAPSIVTLPRPNWVVAQLAWAPDSRAVYALAYPVTDRPQGELWRIDPTTRGAEQVAGSLPTDLRIHRVTADGRSLLGQSATGAVVVDLTNGRTQTSPLPSEAVVVH